MTGRKRTRGCQKGRSLGYDNVTDLTVGVRETDPPRKDKRLSEGTRDTDLTVGNGTNKGSKRNSI